MDCHESDGRLDDGRRRLAADHWKLAIYYAESFARRFPSLREEFHSAAGMGTVNAAMAWDGLRDFKPLLKTVVRKACLQVCYVGGLRIAPSVKLTLWDDFNRTGHSSGEPDRSYTDPAAPDEWPAIVARLDGDGGGFGLLAAMIRRPRDREALTLHYLEDMTQREVGDRMGISHQWVGKLISRAHDDIRERLAGRLVA